MFRNTLNGVDIFSRKNEILMRFLSYVNLNLKLLQGIAREVERTAVGLSAGLEKQEANCGLHSGTGAWAWGRQR
jgi:hypothetical protein